MKLPIAAAMLLCMLGLAGCSQMESRLARTTAPTGTPMTIPDMSPSQNVGIAQPLPPISGPGTSIASSPQPMYNMPDRLDLSVKPADSVDSDIATPVRKATKTTTKAPAAEKPASKTEATAEATTVAPEDVDTTMLAQPVRKGSARKAKPSKSSEEEEKSSSSPQSRNVKTNGKDIMPVSNPAAQDEVDSKQFS